ncbi:MAG: recombinase family protein [Desulfobacterales bacterium]|nr:recombinase family protein [Desulfobacterales bacterium]
MFLVKFNEILLKNEDNMKPAEVKSKHRVVAYLRISIGDQDINTQRLELHEYARKNDLKIDEFIETEIFFDYSQHSNQKLKLC